MMKQFLFFYFLSIQMACFAQQDNYDIIRYRAPTGWAKDIKGTYVSYTFIDKRDTSWCQIVIYKSVPSKGNVETDFLNEWNTIAARPNKITGAPQSDPVSEADGWKIKTGASLYSFEGRPAIAILTTFSGYGKCVSILAKASRRDYVDNMYSLLKTVELEKNISAPRNASPTGKTVAGFQFQTTNFDDGWTSTQQEDWVEVTKSDEKVLIHYNNTPANESIPEREKLEATAWNTFIAPRYSNIRNTEKLKNNIGYEAVHFMAGNMTDKNGREVFVVLFQKGNKFNSWIEIISPSRKDFTRTFGIDQYDFNFTGWDVLAKLASYNRFAVAASDLGGTWTTNFNGMAQYVNVYTGANAGMDTYSSKQQFAFKGSTYLWQIQVAKGFVGNIQYQQAKSNGTFAVKDNWHLTFSDIEGRPQTMDAWFTATKGARLLWLNGSAFVRIDKF